MAEPTYKSSRARRRQVRRPHISTVGRSDATERQLLALKEENQRLWRIITDEAVRLVELQAEVADLRAQLEALREDEGRPQSAGADDWIDDDDAPLGMWCSWREGQEDRAFS